jgi:T5orf172 domain
MAENQIVYVLTNPAMPGLVKIGKTTQLEVEDRMKQLYSTGIPVPFDCAFACQVKDASEVEKALHFAFGNVRINPNREFFKLEPERVVAVLKLLKVDEITSEFEKQIESDTDAADKQSAVNLKEARRPRMNFIEIGIPVGAKLQFKSGGAEVTIVNEKKILYNDQECSLTSATRKVLGLAEDYPLQPSPHWLYQGKTVKDIYDAYHNGEDDS